MKNNILGLFILTFALSFSTAAFGQKSEADFLKLSEEQSSGASRDYDGAIRTLSECLKIKPDSYKCYSSRAFAYSSKHDPERAVADFTQAIKLRPKYPNYYSNRGYIYYEDLKNYDAAIADYSEAVKLAPDSSGDYRMRGHSYYKNRNYDAAINDYTQAINLELKREYNSAGYYYEDRARAYCESGKTELAIDDEKKATAAGVKISSPCAAVDTSVSSLSANKPQAAIANNPPDPSLVSQIRLPPTQTAEDFFKLGNQQASQKDLEAAIKSYTECIRINPNSDGCYFNRGTANFSAKHYDAAIQDFTQVIKLTPQDARAYIRRGLSYSAEEKYELVVADYEVALKLNPNNELVKKSLTDVRELIAAQKDYSAAKEKQDNLINTAKNFLEQGKRQMTQGDFDAAITSYGKCIENDALNLECYYYRGLVYATRKNYDDAIVDFTTIILVKPQPEFYFRRALVYREKQNYDEAIKDFTEAVKIAPQDANLLTERGGTYIYKGDYVSAIADLNQAIKMNAQAAKSYFIRGLAYELSGNKDSAIADYKKALQLSPDYAPAKSAMQKLGVQP